MSLLLTSNVAYTGDDSKLPFLGDMNNVDALSIVGTRRLKGSYYGAILRVKRSSDSTEKDILSIPDGSLDTTSLLSFVGVGDGTVTIVYDQSGNNNDFIAPSLVSEQPFIVLNSELRTTISAEPCLYFSSSPKALYLKNPVIDTSNYVGAMIEGNFIKTGFMLVDTRSSTTTMFKVEGVDTSVRFVYREKLEEAAIITLYDAPMEPNSRYFAALDAVANKAITKDRLSVKNETLVDYIPANASGFAIGANKVTGGSSLNAVGNITAFALVNTSSGGDELMSII